MSQYNHIREYPYLARFCEEEAIVISAYSHPYAQLTLNDIVAHSIPDESRGDFESRREVINKCLEFGYKHKILNQDKRSRIKGPEFWSVIGEMKVGSWLEEQGINIICFEPPSADNGKGDYLIKRGNHEVFIEVKTLFGERDMLEQDQLTSDIAQYCWVNELPVESVNIVNYPANSVNNGDKQNLLEEVVDLIRKNLPITEKRQVSYSGQNGIEIEVYLVPGVRRVSWRQYGGESNLINALKIRLGMFVNGRQYKLQSSIKEIPSICIINDFAFNIDKPIVEAVLYGNLIQDSTRSVIRHYRERGGKWSVLSSSVLSSVFVLQFQPITTKVNNLYAYLCPNPKYEFSKFVFSDPKIVWHKLDKEGIFIVIPGFMNKLYKLVSMFRSLKCLFLP